MALGQGLTDSTERLVVLCVNTGSSSLKCGLFETDGREERALASIDIDGDQFADHNAALGSALDQLEARALPAPAAAGHRIVHGGPDHVVHARIDEHLLESLRKAVPFAPLHLPGAIAAIEAVEARYPGLAQVACFDTAFHAALPERVRRLPLPDALWDAGVRHYGFHGLSYEYVVAHVGADTLGRAVVAHLGNGASLAAIRDGESIDTTMGFTPTGGIVMGTRSGDLDPGVMVYLLRQGDTDADALEQLIDRQSGLLALSGRTSDMRELLEVRGAEPRAALAVEVFCYRVRLQIGAYAAALGGLDTLVFTGGIGEHAAAIREESCLGLEHLGVQVDAGRNARHDAVISPENESCVVRVVRTDEDAMIARHTRELMKARTS